MNIEYLNELSKNPTLEILKSGNFLTNRPISLLEIQQLEQTWNNGNPFPKVLRELLFLAGDFCYVCDYGPTESQQEIQEWVREHLEDNNRNITRPFYAFDVYGGDTFLFIYLDEGNNPTVYQAKPYSDDNIWIKSLDNQTIQSLINIGIDRVKKGQNPY